MEESTKEKSQTVKAGILKWQQFFSANMCVCKNLALLILLYYVW